MATHDYIIFIDYLGFKLVVFLLFHILAVLECFERILVTVTKDFEDLNRNRLKSFFYFYLIFT